MMVVRFHKTKPTVATGMISRLIKINVYFGMPKRTTSSIAGYNSRLGFFRWHLSNQVNGKIGIHCLGSIFKAN